MSADPMDFWSEIYRDALTEENAIDFDSFSYVDAWALGSEMVTAAMNHDYPVAIAIVFGEQLVFHAALKGSSATNDDWLARKFRAVYKHNCSSWALECQQRAMGRLFRRERLPHLRYRPGGRRSAVAGARVAEARSACPAWRPNTTTTVLTR